MDDTADATSLPPDIPPEAVAFLREMDYLTPDRLKPGDQVEPIDLATPTGGATVEVGTMGARPVVLVFGSYT